MPGEDPVIPPGFLGAFGLLERDGTILLVRNRRRIDGRATEVWDLPGGGVEEGETLREALVREMREETGLAVEPGALLFVQEGERIVAGRRRNLWRSFFFGVRAPAGRAVRPEDPEVLGSRFAPLRELPSLLVAPYHAGFLRWMESGRTLPFVFDTWADHAPGKDSR